MKTTANNPGTTRKGFIQRDHRGNIVVLLIIVFVAVLTLSILSLLSNKHTHYRDSEDNGVGRPFAFPFVFIDENGTLRIIPDDAMKVVDIDDTVTQCVHDGKQSVVYYVRENVLYEYKIKSNTRKQLVSDVSQFMLTESRNAIFVIDTKNYIKFYDGQDCRMISKEERRPEQFYSMGKNAILYLEDYRSEDETAVLCKLDEKGNVQRYDFRVDAEKDFRFSLDGKKICYYTGNTFCVAKTNGTIIDKFYNAVPVFEAHQPVLQLGETANIQYDKSIPVHYIVAAVSSESDRVLLYFNGSKSKQIATGIDQILYYSHDADMILYTCVEQDGSKKVYKSTGGSVAEAQISCHKDTKFIFDDKQDYLYYQLPNGTLYRYNIYDVGKKSVKVADDTGLLYLYPNKPFVIYASKDSSKMYLVHSDNSVEQYPADAQWRLYGRNNHKYLMLRTYGANRISLDFVNQEEATRISGDVAGSVFFDKNMEHVLYTSNSSLYCWNDGNSKKICHVGQIAAAPVVA